MKMYFCGYRSWAKEIYNNLIKESGLEILLIQNKQQFNEIENLNNEILFFIGWSWILEKEIVENNYCICLHPSKLPKYRGGSPIQHQIINGEKESAVTLFKMNEFVDKGNILFQENFSLDGDLNDVFRRISIIGAKGINQIINKFINNTEIHELEQDFKKGSYCRRRKPHMSEIKIVDLKNQTAEQLYNKIRALQDPYPNAYITCADGKKLYLFGAKTDD
tara:strand:+ start:4778 stop:5437 length:660 start_codon:yes stop_codon:yes gene_type:complete